ncbi:hypothetical protein L9F63_015700, partial [Diploptera punctata]
NYRLYQSRKSPISIKIFTLKCYDDLNFQNEFYPKKKHVSQRKKRVKLHGSLPYPDIILNISIVYITWSVIFSLLPMLFPPLLLVSTMLGRDNDVLPSGESYCLKNKVLKTFKFGLMRDRRTSRHRCNWDRNRGLSYVGDISFNFNFILSTYAEITNESLLDGVYFSLFEIVSVGFIFFSVFHFFLSLTWNCNRRHFEIAFRMFDLNGDGDVDSEEFEKVATLIRQQTSIGSRPETMQTLEILLRV